MPIRCQFSTAGNPYLLELHRSDIAVSDLRFQLRSTGTLLTGDAECPVSLEQIQVRFAIPQQHRDDDLLITSVEFQGECQLRSTPDLDTLPSGAELDYGLDIQLADGQDLEEGIGWSFLQSDSLPLS